jgi:biotin-(acetyl-CoA carboxylase) ligase
MQQIRDIDGRLSMIEAVHIGILGAMSKKGSEGARVALKWRRDLAAKRNKLAGVSTETIWDRLKGRSRKL